MKTSHLLNVKKHIPRRQKSTHEPSCLKLTTSTLKAECSLYSYPSVRSKIAQAFFHANLCTIILQ